MSARALGVLVHLLSHHDGYDVSVEKLAVVFSESATAIKATLRELADLGHLERTRVNTRDGFVHMWTVREQPIVGLATDGQPTDGHDADTKKTSSSEDQLGEDQVKNSGSSATRPTTRELADLALVLGETEPILVAATWLALKADGARNPLAYARWLAERGQLDGYLGVHIYAEDYEAEAANL
jgi:hypothetical protein